MTAIYNEVCDDLKVYPQAMKPRTHQAFMRDHEHTQWLSEVLANAYGDPLKVRTSRTGKPSRKPGNKP